MRGLSRRSSIALHAYDQQVVVRGGRGANGGLVGIDLDTHDPQYGVSGPVETNRRKGPALRAEMDNLSPATGRAGSLPASYGAKGNML